MQNELHWHIPSVPVVLITGVPHLPVVLVWSWVLECLTHCGTGLVLGPEYQLCVRYWVLEYLLAM